MFRQQVLLGMALSLLATVALAQESAMEHAHPTSHDEMLDMADMQGMEGMEGMEGMDHSGGHSTMWHRGPWQLMAHGTLNLVYDDQGGPRGGRQGLLSGMVMGSATRPLGEHDSLQLRLMLSPEPLMGAKGYPLLLAAGETADGQHLLVDRQHPHDLFMEVSARYSHALATSGEVWIYAGLPGQPAFGPAAFMHRESINDSPEAPIAHHWLDSTHVSFGVLTGGLRLGQWTLEASGFRGREPDQHRFDIETPRLDSWATRLTWQPTTTISLQTSWAQLHSPEALEPQRDERRWTASLSYTGAPSERGWWASTWAIGRKQPDGLVVRTAWSAEASYHPMMWWSLYGRIEQVESDEWQANLPLQQAHKLTLGVVHDWPLWSQASLGLGLQLSQSSVSSALRPSYGEHPYSGMAYLRLRTR